MFRLLRNTIFVLCIVACVAFVILWVRSYQTAERLHGRLWKDQVFLIASKQGRLTVLPFRPHSAPGWWNSPGRWKWEIQRYPLDHEFSFPSGDMRDYESVLGFGMIPQPSYQVFSSIQRPLPASPYLVTPLVTPDDGPPWIENPPWISAGSGAITLHGTAIILPYWFLVLLSTVVATISRMKRPWRYSMRSLFVTVTLIAALLGMVAVLDN